jgi:hypothetical protein
MMVVTLAAVPSTCVAVRPIVEAMWPPALRRLASLTPSPAA